MIIVDRFECPEPLVPHLWLAMDGVLRAHAHMLSHWVQSQHVLD